MSSTNGEEAEIAAQIARLEAELERAKLESQLKKLQAELNAIENVGNDQKNDEYLVIEDDYEYENADDEYYEEYIEEEYYEEEEEYTEEYMEEEVIDEVAPAQTQPAPKVQIHKSLDQAHSNLRKTTNNVIQKEIETATLNASVAPTLLVTPPPVVAKVTPLAPEPPAASQPRTVKSKVRPPPSQGGKPVTREDPKEDAPKRKKFPLSGLLRQRNKSTDGGSENNTDDGTYTKKIITAKPGVPKKPLSSSNDAGSTTSVAVKPVATAPTKSPSGTTTAPYKRRAIPNLQPSPEGQETIFEQLLGPKLLVNAQLQKCTTRGCLKDQEMIGLYFGSSWKSDCKRFMPLLKQFYFATSNAHNFEMIYISADRSLIEFKDCYGKMPYLAIPAGTTALKNALTKTLKIIEMPALVILDDDANVVTVQGVDKIVQLHETSTAENYNELASQLMERWKKTRPIPMEEVKKDNALLYSTIDRGTVYWN